MTKNQITSNFSAGITQAKAAIISEDACRELACVLTKLDEAALWFGKWLEEQEKKYEKR